MRKELKVRFTKTCDGNPLIDIQELGGYGLEYTPEQLKSLAKTLKKIALDGERISPKGWQEYHY